VGVARGWRGQDGRMNHYEIRVVGHLDVRRARALGAEECRWLPDGHSVLVFAAVDQAATYGLLARVRDAGLELVAVARTEPALPEPGAPGTAESVTNQGQTRGR
jgi:hypothetical protein